ncbi:glycosyltransferase [Paenibacillus montanisoli]|uniref:Glycosyl transferase n=1 Tax=Paenibacillus montanisoli TaxID=2081970 RepID=A0A328TZH2_9BACL|nr:glycosyltransferase [Paenibacillus montanisoli]RAP74561.1 hypothetical protein DL346_21090 [Paenibacillus montanisoli]
MIVCTSINANYIPKAKVLAKSMKEKNPNTTVVICLLEEKIHPACKDFDYFDEIILATDLGIPDFKRFIFMHNKVEASTAVKGNLFLYLLNKYKTANKFVYLDPDIFVLGRLNELEKALNHHSIVLTPHLLEPEESLEAVWDNEICALQHGAFNLGFLAISRSDESLRFIHWWANRLLKFCHDNIPQGLFTDQKWMDLAPSFFDILILKHCGYNVAPWNLSRRKITISDQGDYLTNGLPLRFFHFSGFDSFAFEGMLNKYVPDKNNAVHSLANQYKLEIANMGQNLLGNEPWSYDYYCDGEPISHHARIHYRHNLTLQNQYTDPFQCSNQIFG